MLVKMKHDYACLKKGQTVNLLNSNDGKDDEPLVAYYQNGQWRYIRVKKKYLELD